MAERSPVILFLVDGMRPDGMMAADTPAMDTLRRAGVWTLTAQTTKPSMTLPCHTSLFLGVPPARHGITTNVWSPPVRPVPGLFDVVQQAGLITAMFYNWEELRDLARPGSLHVSFMVKSLEDPARADWEVAQAAATWLHEHGFDFAFVYLGGTDLVGHRDGWMSAPYLKAIAHADQCIKVVMEALPAGCTVLVTSDHGGHEQTHGAGLAEDLTIPLVMCGPSIPAHQRIQLPVTITDIAPTICHMLGVKTSTEWIGAPISLP